MQSERHDDRDMLYREWTNQRQYQQNLSDYQRMIEHRRLIDQQRRQAQLELEFAAPRPPWVASGVYVDEHGLFITTKGGSVRVPEAMLKSLVALAEMVLLARLTGADQADPTESDPSGAGPTAAAGP